MGMRVYGVQGICKRMYIHARDRIKICEESHGNLGLTLPVLYDREPARFAPVLEHLDVYVFFP